MKVLKLQWLVMILFALAISGCSEEDIQDIVPTKIDENNAEEMARHGLDMMEVGSLSKDIAEYVKVNDPDNSAVSQTMNCSDVFTGATGTLTVTGSTLASGGTSYSLNISFNDCAVNNLTLNGSVATTSTTVDTTKTKSVSGSLSVTNSQSLSGSVTLSLDNFWFDKISDTVTNPDNYTKEFGMTLGIPVAGDVSVGGSFGGVDTNNPDNPTSGTMTVSASGASRVTAVDNLNFALDVDPEGDGSFVPVDNGNGSNTYAW
jgi:hypothetical protein